MIGSMASIGAVGGTIQNLALYLSLDRKFPQVTIDTTFSLILVGSVVGRLAHGVARGPMAEAARHAADLRDRGAQRSRRCSTRRRPRRCRSVRSSSASVSAAIT